MLRHFLTRGIVLMWLAVLVAGCVSDTTTPAATETPTNLHLQPTVAPTKIPTRRLPTAEVTSTNTPIGNAKEMVNPCKLISAGELKMLLGDVPDPSPGTYDQGGYAYRVCDYRTKLGFVRLDLTTNPDVPKLFQNTLTQVKSAKGLKTAKNSVLTAYVIDGTNSSGVGGFTGAVVKKTTVLGVRMLNNGYHYDDDSALNLIFSLGGRLP